jgi:hypothetical protein
MRRLNLGRALHLNTSEVRRSEDSCTLTHRNKWRRLNFILIIIIIIKLLTTHPQKILQQRQSMAAFALVLVIVLTSAAGQAGTTSTGCICFGPCARTIDTLTDPWCTTSESPVNSDTPRCGDSLYSISRHAWWDYCTVNVTSSSPDESLTTLTSAWTVMTTSTTAALAAVYLVAGCTASVLTSPQRTIYWLPCAAALIGALHGCIVGGISSLFIAFIFFSM